MKRLHITFLLALCLISLSGLARAERTMTIKHLSNASSYFSIMVNDSGALRGRYPGWCAQWAKRIDEGTVYKAKYFSSYSHSLPPGLLDHPENLDEMNWLINQHAVGKNAGGSLGTFTSGDVQLAIWTLLNNEYDASTVGPYSQDRVDLLVSRALSEGSGFYPNYRQVVGVLLQPNNGSNDEQITIPEVPVCHFHKCAIPEVLE